jgi:hypothetical protein
MDENSAVLGRLLIPRQLVISPREETIDCRTAHGTRLQLQSSNPGSNPPAQHWPRQGWNASICKPRSEESSSSVRTGGARAALAMLARALHLPWDNERKDPLWLLVHNGLPTAERMSSSTAAPRAAPPAPCACGATGPGCARHFWDCPAAQALVTSISAAAGQPISRAQLWLARPSRGVHASVWKPRCWRRWALWTTRARS